MASERTCENCRWFRFDMLYHGNPHGVCRRAPPVSGEFSEVSGGSVCGEWADKNITNEQAEQRELVRRFALALVTAGYQDKVHKIWQRAAEFADYEGQVMAGFTTTTTTYKSKD